MKALLLSVVLLAADGGLSLYASTASTLRLHTEANIVIGAGFAIVRPDGGCDVAGPDGGTTHEVSGLCRAMWRAFYGGAM